MPKVSPDFVGNNVAVKVNKLTGFDNWKKYFTYQINNQHQNYSNCFLTVYVTWKFFIIFTEFFFTGWSWGAQQGERAELDHGQSHLGQGHWRGISSQSC